jgi:hypothetical protein
MVLNGNVIPSHAALLGHERSVPSEGLLVVDVRHELAAERPKPALQTQDEKRLSARQFAVKPEQHGGSKT